MNSQKPPIKFVRTTITLPDELEAFAAEQARSEHFGNFSGYIRSLIHREHRRLNNRNGRKPSPELVA